MGECKEHNVVNMLRKKGAVITTYVVIITIIFIVAAALLMNTTKDKGIQDIVYTENSNIDYKVYLKENDFFEDNYLGKDNQYIASLINYVEANFRYELDSQEKNIDYQYTYKVIADVNVQDEKTKNSLYKFNETLVEEKEYSANTNSKLKINQPIKIDYNKYNDLINKFVDVYDLEDSEANLTINMYVDVIDDVEQVNNVETPVMTLKIPLTTKTMAIDIESQAVNANNISVYKTIDNKGYIFGAIVLLMIDFIIINKLATFIRDTKDEESIYNMKLRKIMVSYGSYVQKLNSEFSFSGYQIVDIKLFEDLLQIRETINKPILMCEEDNAMETYFFIPTHDTIYMYEIKPGTFQAKRENKNKAKNRKENSEEIKL